MCKARQYSDTMICGPCGLQWDVNDIDPPQCQPKNKPKVEHYKPPVILTPEERARGVQVLKDLQKLFD